jgi:CRP/FNR family transcriptional regulator, cyclic AMP receptor protein
VGVRIMSDTIDMLAYVPLFALLDEEERAALANVLEGARFPKGQAIFRTGDVGGALYLVNAGLIRVSFENNEGAQVILGEYGRGQVFGEISLLDGGPRTSTALALEDTEVVILNRSHLLEMVTKHPHSAMDLLTVIGARLRASDQLLRTQVTRNVNTEAAERLTLGQRLADRVAAFGGSWPFILLFFAVMIVWVVVNTWVLAEQTFDPYPYILLNLVLSMLAALQAPIIMMSQNRQAAKDRLQADLDYRINLKAELEVAHLHKKVDRIWEDLQAQLARAEGTVSGKGIGSRHQTKPIA